MHMVVCETVYLRWCTKKALERISLPLLSLSVGESVLFGHGVLTLDVRQRGKGVRSKQENKHGKRGCSQTSGSFC